MGSLYAVLHCSVSMTLHRDSSAAPRHFQRIRPRPVPVGRGCPDPSRPSVTTRDTPARPEDAKGSAVDAATVVDCFGGPSPSVALKLTVDQRQKRSWSVGVRHRAHGVRSNPVAGVRTRSPWLRPTAHRPALRSRLRSDSGENWRYVGRRQTIRRGSHHARSCLAERSQQ